MLPMLQTAFSPAALDGRRYLPSLVQEGVRCGLLDDAALLRLQTGLTEQLERQADCWSRGESSSLPVEKARRLMDSILFVVGLALKAAPSPEAGVAMLRDKPVADLFEAGMRQVSRKLTTVRWMRQSLRHHLFETKNRYFRATALDGVGGFLKLYRPQLAAQEIYITADYPVCLGRPELDGVEFIEEYLRRIKAENDFCRCFSPDRVDLLLCGLTPDYPDIPMNLFEPVFLSSMGLTLLGRNPTGLDLTPDEVTGLQKRFTGQSAEGLGALFAEALTRLRSALGLTEGVFGYCSRCLPGLAAAVNRAVGLGSLPLLFLCPRQVQTREPDDFFSSASLSAQQFAALQNRLLQAADSGERARLILAAVGSLSDFLDVVCALPLEPIDLQQLVEALPQPAFLALCRLYPSDAFLTREGERRLWAALRHRKDRQA